MPEIKIKINMESILERVEKKVGSTVMLALREAWYQVKESKYYFELDFLHLLDSVDQTLDHYEQKGIEPSSELIIALALHDCDRFFQDSPKLEDFKDRKSYKQEHAFVSAQRAKELLGKSDLEPELISRASARILVHHAHWHHDEIQELFETIDERGFWRVYLKSYLERIDKDRTPEQVKDKMREKYVGLSDEDKLWVEKQVEEINSPVLHRLFQELKDEFV